MSSTRSSRISATALTLHSLLSFYIAPAVSQSSCSLQTPLAQTIIHEQVVSLQATVLTNTSFYPIPEVAVTVTNAPTSLDTLTTLSWSQTRPYTAFNPPSASFQTSIVPTPSPTDESSYVLIIQGLSSVQKRQSPIFVGVDGATTSNCSNTPTYRLANGVLTSIINGQTYYFSTEPGVAYAPFVPSLTPGSITTYFAAANNGIVSWINSLFWNGEAQFCSTDNGTVLAIFQQNEAPEGCRFIQLSFYNSRCALSADGGGPSGLFCVLSNE